MSNTSIYYFKWRKDRKEMAQLLPEHYSRVLEIGCAEGDFRENLIQEHEYWGVEPIESKATLASKKLDKVLIGTYQKMSYQIPNDYYDLVICNDVIEHMVDHDKFFLSIKKKIKKDGCLVASIPNVRYLPNLIQILVKKDWEYTDYGILDKTHLRFFTKKSLTRTIVDNGYIIDQFMGLHPCTDAPGLKRYLYYFAILLFGQDARFLHFGIRIRCNDQNLIAALR